MQSSAINVLLVAESISDQAHMVEHFERNKMNLAIAESIEKAKRMLSDLPPNIVVADDTLPDGEGIELLKSSTNKPFPLLLLLKQNHKKAYKKRKSLGSVTEVVKTKPLVENLPEVTEKTYQLWVKDIALKKAEEKQKRQQREINKLKDELNRFDYSVSHELRGPMSTMTGLINVARMESSRDNIHEYLNFMHDCMSKLDIYIKDLSNYSDNKRTDSRIRKFDIGKVVKWVLEKQSVESNFKNIKINTNINAHHTAYSDPNRIELILNNLVSNAIKHQDIEKAEQTVTIDIEVKRLKIIMNIIDNGKGIEPEHLNNVFKMFYRANETSLGSGLGLFIAKEAIDKLNGTINIRSFIKKGTNITVVIPNRQR